MIWNGSKPLEPIDPRSRRIRVTLVSFAGALAYVSVICIFGWKFGLEFGAILLIPIDPAITIEIRTASRCISRHSE